MGVKVGGKIGVNNFGVKVLWKFLGNFGGRSGGNPQTVNSSQSCRKSRFRYAPHSLSLPWGNLRGQSVSQYLCHIVCVTISVSHLRRHASRQKKILTLNFLIALIKLGSWVKEIPGISWLLRCQKIWTLVELVKAYITFRRYHTTIK